jgi:SET domain-containing protein
MEKLFEIKKSKKQGKGLFALKDIKKGEKLYVLKKGKTVRSNQIRGLTELEKKYLDQIGENEYEIIEPPGCLINHSCEPNVEEKDRTGIAIKDICRGEEICINYDEHAYLEKPFKCRCGSKGCRGVVRGKNCIKK